MIKNNGLHCNIKGKFGDGSLFVFWVKWGLSPNFHFGKNGTVPKFPLKKFYACDNI